MPNNRDKYLQSGLGGRQGGGRRPCLLVIDLVYGFTDPGSPLSCDVSRALKETSLLLRAARDGNAPRVFFRVEYDDAGLVLAARFLEKIPALKALTPGSRWSEIDDAIAPGPGEPVITKCFASAFFGTPLQSLLTTLGCDTVVLTGVSTSGCVRATAVDAVQHGYSVVVPRSAVGDRAAEPHEAALFDIDMKYGEVVDTEDALRLLEGAHRR